jgi:glycosyltransferase involved in cell wall biosynthesis
MDAARALPNLPSAHFEPCPIPEFARILMLSIVNPQSERNGAATVTRGLIKLLEMPPLRAQVECIPVRANPRKGHRFAQACSLISSLASDLPAKPFFLHSRRFQKTVETRIRSEHYDLVVLNGSDLLWVSKYLPVSIPRILVAHNIEHVLFHSQIQGLTWPYRPLRTLLENDCRRLEDFEWNGMRETANVIFLSNEEAAYAARSCEGLRSITSPPLFDYRPSRRRFREAGAILQIGYLGNFRWWPNQCGLRWFATQVLPHLRSPIRLNLFGQGSDSLSNGDQRIVGHGVVEDIERVWDACDFLICPVLSNFGVSVKLAEAIYNRIPVLATSVAARGLPFSNDPAIVLLDKPEEWVEFLGSDAATDLVTRQVSQKIADRFSIDFHQNVLQQFVADVISCYAPSRAAK